MRYFLYEHLVKCINAYIHVYTCIQPNTNRNVYIQQLFMDAERFNESKLYAIYYVIFLPARILEGAGREVVEGSVHMGAVAQAHHIVSMAILGVELVASQTMDNA